MLKRYLLVCLSTLTIGIANAAMVTDITVFSSNGVGNNWNGLIWNTQGKPADVPDRWNLYVTPDAASKPTPSFLNGFNDDRTRVALPLAEGTQTWTLFANGVGSTFDPLQHFVLNLYFDGEQAAPGISGLQNLGNTNLSAAGHPNGLDIFGASGHAEAGTLTTMIGDLQVTLTSFTWDTSGRRDVVYPHWANDAPYSTGGAGADYIGSFTLEVARVPEPSTLALIALSLGCLVGTSRRRMRGCDACT